VKKLVPISSEYISYTVTTQTKPVPKLDPITNLPIWVNAETGEQTSSQSNPNPASNLWVSVMENKEVPVVTITVAQEGIPEGAKSIKLLYLYIDKEDEETDEPDAEQPAPGVSAVGAEINIDENTTYPLTGEFIIDGTPESIEPIINKKVQYEKFQSGYYWYGFNNQFNDLNTDENSQLEVIDANLYSSYGGISIRGSKIGIPVIEGGE